MSLNGAKLISLDKDGGRGEELSAKGRRFTVGYYVSCDLVLPQDIRLKGVHCEIQCDAFGRVTVHSMSDDHPILLNDNTVRFKRPLLHGSRLKILNHEFLWDFPKITSSECVDVADAQLSTPEKLLGIPEQPSTSCPNPKIHQPLVSNRFTVHNFRYSINSDEEGNCSMESNVENTNAESLNDVKTELITTRNDSERRSLTPEPNSVLLINREEKTETNLLVASQNKDNNSNTLQSRKLLSLCRQSDVVITSFSPRQTGVRIEKTFTAIIKPTGLASAVNSPKSVYSTPKSVLFELNEDGNSRDNLEFSTPSTSKKLYTRLATTNTSMHLIDLTTPTKLRPTSKTPKQCSAMKQTPILMGTIGTDTPNSAITVDSTDESSPSFIELSSNSDSPTKLALVKPLKTPTKSASSTPMRTPQSLMKRALLTSAKKKQHQFTSAIKATQSPKTPKSTSARNALLAERRQSLSTPMRRLQLGASNTGSESRPSTSSKTYVEAAKSVRRSLLVPHYTAGISTSTPLNTATKQPCTSAITSPISKMRRTISSNVAAQSPSRYKTQISPTALSSKLVAKARKSLCTPQQAKYTRPLGLNAASMLNRSQSARKPATLTSSPKVVEIPKAASSGEKASSSHLQQTTDDLSRTFTIEDSDEDSEHFSLKDAKHSPKSEPVVVKKTLTVKDEYKDTAELLKKIDYVLNKSDEKELKKSKESEIHAQEVAALSTDELLNKIDYVLNKSDELAKELELRKKKESDAVEATVSKKVILSTDELLNQIDIVLNKSDELEKAKKTKEVEIHAKEAKASKDVQLSTDELLSRIDYVLNKSDELAKEKKRKSDLSTAIKTKENEIQTLDATESEIVTISKDDMKDSDINECLENVNIEDGDMKTETVAAEVIVEPVTSTTEEQNIGVEEIQNISDNVENLTQTLHTEIDKNIEKLNEGEKISIEVEKFLYEIDEPKSIDAMNKSMVENIIAKEKHIGGVDAAQGSAVAENVSIREVEAKEFVLDILGKNKSTTIELESDSKENVTINNISIEKELKPGLDMCMTTTVKTSVNVEKVKDEKSKSAEAETNLTLNEPEEVIIDAVVDNKAKLLKTQTEQKDFAANSKTAGLKKQLDLPTDKYSVLTPRRSARRASMTADRKPFLQQTSAESSSTIETTRRASFSAEILLTPKRILTRRLSIDGERSPVKRQQKTPRKTLLYEDVADDMGAIVEETDNEDGKSNEAKTPVEKDITNKVITPANDFGKVELVEESICEEVLNENSGNQQVATKSVEMIEDGSFTAFPERCLQITQTTNNDSKILNVTHVSDADAHDYGKELISTPKQSKSSLKEKKEGDEEVQREIEADVENLDFYGMRELLKTPKNSSTPHFKGIREMLKTPKDCSTPIMAGIKELLNTPAAAPSTPKRRTTPFAATIASMSVVDDNLNRTVDEGLDKFFKTPRAKNLMIPNDPASAVLEKNHSTQLDQLATECTLSASNATLNLGTIFETPLNSRFASRLKEAECEEIELDIDGDDANVTNREAERSDRDKEVAAKKSSEKQNLSAEEAFDELVGLPSHNQTPARNIYERKSQKLVHPSPFSASDVISDLPKTDVQEWVDSLEDIESENDVLSFAEIVESVEVLDDTEKDISESSMRDPLESTLKTKSPCEEPKSMAKIFLNINSTNTTTDNDQSTVSTTYDPLASSALKTEESSERKPVSNFDSRPASPTVTEMSGIQFLDNTAESILDESGELIEPLMVSCSDSIDTLENEPERGADMVSKSTDFNEMSDNLGDVLIVSDIESFTSDDRKKSAEQNKTIEVGKAEIEVENTPIKDEETPIEVKETPVVIEETPMKPLVNVENLVASIDLNTSIDLFTEDSLSNDKSNNEDANNQECVETVSYENKEISDETKKHDDNLSAETNNPIIQTRQRSISSTSAPFIDIIDEKTTEVTIEDSNSSDGVKFVESTANDNDNVPTSMEFTTERAIESIIIDESESNSTNIDSEINLSIASVNENVNVAGSVGEDTNNEINISAINSPAPIDTIIIDDEDTESGSTKSEVETKTLLSRTSEIELKYEKPATHVDKEKIQSLDNDAREKTDDNAENITEVQNEDIEVGISESVEGQIDEVVTTEEKDEIIFELESTKSEKTDRDIDTETTENIDKLENDDVEKTDNKPEDVTEVEIENMIENAFAEPEVKKSDQKQIVEAVTILAEEDFQNVKGKEEKCVEQVENKTLQLEKIDQRRDSSNLKDPAFQKNRKNSENNGGDIDKETTENIDKLENDDVEKTDNKPKDVSEFENGNLIENAVAEHEVNKSDQKQIVEGITIIAEKDFQNIKEEIYSEQVENKSPESEKIDQRRGNSNLKDPALQKNRNKSEKTGIDIDEETTENINELENDGAEKSENTPEDITENATAEPVPEVKKSDQEQIVEAVTALVGEDFQNVKAKEEICTEKVANPELEKIDQRRDSSILKDSAFEKDTESQLQTIELATAKVDEEINTVVDDHSSICNAESKTTFGVSENESTISSSIIDEKPRTKVQQPSVLVTLKVSNVGKEDVQRTKEEMQNFEERPEEITSEPNDEKSREVPLEEPSSSFHKTTFTDIVTEQQIDSTAESVQNLESIQEKDEIISEEISHKIEDKATPLCEALEESLSSRKRRSSSKDYQEIPDLTIEKNIKNKKTRKGSKNLEYPSETINLKDIASVEDSSTVAVEKQALVDESSLSDNPVSKIDAPENKLNTRKRQRKASSSSLEEVVVVLADDKPRRKLRKPSTSVRPKISIVQEDDGEGIEETMPTLKEKQEQIFSEPILTKDIKPCGETLEVSTSSDQITTSTAIDNRSDDLNSVTIQKVEPIEKKCDENVEKASSLSTTSNEDVLVAEPDKASLSSRKRRSSSSKQEDIEQIEGEKFEKKIVNKRARKASAKIVHHSESKNFKQAVSEEDAESQVHQIELSTTIAVVDTKKDEVVYEPNTSNTSKTKIDVSEKMSTTRKRLRKASSSSVEEIMSAIDDGKPRRRLRQPSVSVRPKVSIVEEEDEQKTQETVPNSKESLEKLISEQNATKDQKSKEVSAEAASSSDNKTTSVDNIPMQKTADLNTEAVKTVVPLKRRGRKPFASNSGSKVSQVELDLPTTSQQTLSTSKDLSFAIDHNSKIVATTEIEKPLPEPVHEEDKRPRRGRRGPTSVESKLEQHKNNEESTEEKPRRRGRKVSDRNTQDTSAAEKIVKETDVAETNTKRLQRSSAYIDDVKSIEQTVSMKIVPQETEAEHLEQHAARRRGRKVAAVIDDDEQSNKVDEKISTNEVADAVMEKPTTEKTKRTRARKPSTFPEEIDHASEENIKTMAVNAELASETSPQRQPVRRGRRKSTTQSPQTPQSKSTLKSENVEDSPNSSATKREGRNLPRRNYDESSDTEAAGTSRQRIRKPTPKAIQLLEICAATPKKGRRLLNTAPAADAITPATPQIQAKGRGRGRGKAQAAKPTDNEHSPSKKLSPIEIIEKPPATAIEEMTTTADVIEEKVKARVGRGRIGKSKKLIDDNVNEREELQAAEEHQMDTARHITETPKKTRATRGGRVVTKKQEQTNTEEESDNIQDENTSGDGNISPNADNREKSKKPSQRHTRKPTNTETADESEELPEKKTTRLRGRGNKEQNEETTAVDIISIEAQSSDKPQEKQTKATRKRGRKATIETLETEPPTISSTAAVPTIDDDTEDDAPLAQVAAKQSPVKPIPATGKRGRRKVINEPTAEPTTTDMESESNATSKPTTRGGRTRKVHFEPADDNTTSSTTTTTTENVFETTEAPPKRATRTRRK